MPHRWSQSAAIRARQIESGLDITFNKVFVPLYCDLVSQNRPRYALEVGAGTGHLAKELVKYCDNLVAIEPSDGMYEIASSVLHDSNVKIYNQSSFDYRSEIIFDFAYSHLCAHTVNDITKYFLSIRQLLRDEGTFVFSIPHPYFYELDKNYFDENWGYMDEAFMHVDLTITKDKENPINNVPYWHRPLSSYINSFILSGFSLKRMIEVWPQKDVMDEYTFSWKGPRYCLFVCSFVLQFDV